MRLVLVLACCACADILIAPDPATTPRLLFDQVWHEFDRTYASFAVRHIDWAAEYMRYRPMIDTAQSTAVAGEIVGTMLADLNDPHVELLVPYGVVYHSFDRRSVHTYFRANTVLADYLTNPRRTEIDSLRYATFKTDPSVGYVGISSFGGNQWGGDINSVLQSFADVTALVIDVRDNGGGNPANAVSMADRFIETPAIVGFQRFRIGPGHDDFTDFIPIRISPAHERFGGRVIILTNGFTASAAETFVLAMRLRSGCIVVGDRTLGASGTTVVRELADGWTYRLPQSIGYDAEKKTYEGTGIEPDILIALTASDSIARRDVQLDSALALARRP